MRISIRFLGSALLTCGLLLPGCTGPKHHSTAPAPKPAPKPAADGLSHTAMAFPTGDRDTSVILL